LLLLVSAAATIVLLIASYQDLRHRIIPDAVPVVIAVLAAVKWAAIGLLSPALWAVAAAVAIFALAAFAFARGWMGGGDVKLMAAVAFLLGAPAAPRFLLVMALIGGALAVVMLALRPRRPAGEPPSVPYGVAIALGAIASLAFEWQAGWTA
jgi:prepilin peptidase CpaA